MTDMPHEEDPWSLNMARFILSGASVTILHPDQEMTVRHGLRLLVEEGRQEEPREDHSGQPAPSVLAYVMRIAVKDTGDPDAWVSFEAQIVVVGTHENGTIVTIAGPGQAGWDDKTGLQIEFAAPPKMTAHWPDGTR